MKLATYSDNSRDGALAVVSTDGTRYLSATQIAPTLQAALDDWSTVSADLKVLDEKFNKGEGAPTTDVSFIAPLPRAWQWLDGSAYDSHGALMEKVFGIDPVPLDNPLMYQGVSNQFYSATEDVLFLREEDFIDFEGEFGIIVDDTPMGISADDAMSHIKLIIQLNDWSLRKIAPVEMRTGFGWVQAKPPCSVAPLAVTPDELGGAWKDGRVHLNLVVDFNGERFGAAHGAAMSVGFHELVAHAAATRDLCAGTIIGSGTVSNENYREIGSSCIAERRGIEMLDLGEPKTEFMKFGDRVRMEAQTEAGTTLFGAIDQRVVKR